MPFELPKLPYDYNALEPYIDVTTMEIHHSKHHGAYTSNLNSAILGTELENMSLDDILKDISKRPVAVRNNGGGYYNHNLFWTILSPNGGGEPTGDIAKAINSQFGSFAAFKEEFNKAALSRFGSGWAWLVDVQGRLVISSTPNQDNPKMDVAELKGYPIFGIDVWEHAYYLKYQNRRNEYIAAFWSLINWDEINRRYSCI
ncbi:superoxide dismutase [Williamwhitmania taraxaci]|uniref:Superoxide dismutase n=1 Tax=Williamwhitmania taraxaci TaxID=1640674 RepID=A0A1G6HPU7_9BACT|nr:superoxide dismutase [Williamwhitmania taraxaci]SDB96221.1 superoxide dismutase, Fe-Mn family [Williamwhitmania taraxaci]